jgi:hypothetical protein
MKRDVSDQLSSDCAYVEAFGSVVATCQEPYIKVLYDTVVVTQFFVGGVSLATAAVTYQPLRFRCVVPLQLSRMWSSCENFPIFNESIDRIDGFWHLVAKTEAVARMLGSHTEIQSEVNLSCRIFGEHLSSALRFPVSLCHRSTFSFSASTVSSTTSTQHVDQPLAPQLE